MRMSSRLLLVCIARRVLRTYRWWYVSAVTAMRGEAEDNSQLFCDTGWAPGLLYSANRNRHILVSVVVL